MVVNCEFLNAFKLFGNKKSHLIWTVTLKNPTGTIYIPLKSYFITSQSIDAGNWHMRKKTNDMVEKKHYNHIT